MADNIERVPLWTKIGFGFGHVMNDMCASMWFTYLLLFFHKVLHFNNLGAGVILMIGNNTILINEYFSQILLYFSNIVHNLLIFDSIFRSIGRWLIDCVRWVLF